MSDQTDLARGWLRKACSDLAAACRILSGEGPYDTACFHSQQAMEKTFKALAGLSWAAHSQSSRPRKSWLACASSSNRSPNCTCRKEIWPSQQEARQALALAEQVVR
jgi:HEPN domain-containing protein